METRKPGYDVRTGKIPENLGGLAAMLDLVDMTPCLVTRPQHIKFGVNRFNSSEDTEQMVISENHCWRSHVN